MEVCTLCFNEKFSTTLFLQHVFYNVLYHVCIVLVSLQYCNHGESSGSCPAGLFFPDIWTYLGHLVNVDAAQITSYKPFKEE